MAADAASLEAQAKILLDRADDLYWLGQQLVAKSHASRWQCAKADRYRDAMLARQSEARVLAEQLRDLGRWARAQAAAQAAAAPVPGA